MKSGGIHPAKPVDDKKKQKEEKLKEQKEMALLFKPVQTQKVEKGEPFTMLKIKVVYLDAPMYKEMVK